MTMASQLVKTSTARSSLKRAAKFANELTKVDPKDRYVILFPAADGVRPGLGTKLLNNNAAERVLDEASQILKKDMARLCLGGSEDDLVHNYENKNLAAFVISHATMAKLGDEQPDKIPVCKGAGGFGVGIINALVFSKALSFEDGLDLIKQQTRAMTRAAEIVPGARVLVHLRPATSLAKVCISAQQHCRSINLEPEISVCSVTKKIQPGVAEIAGHEAAIQYLEREGDELFKFKSMKRVRILPHAYHTALMRPAQDFLQVYIEDKRRANSNYIQEPQTCSVYSAIRGKRLRTVGHIIEDLIRYPVECLRIEALIQKLYKRPRELAQPNTYVLWDTVLLQNLAIINARAKRFARLLPA